MNFEGANSPSYYVSVTNFIERYPNFLNWTPGEDWKVYQVGPTFKYPQSVHDSQLYAYNGVFMELFIRKCLCQKFQQPLMDRFTERILNNNSYENCEIKLLLTASYLKYIDPKFDAIDIVNEIKIVAMSQRLTFTEQMENVNNVMDMEVDYANLRAIQEFINSLPYDRLTYKQFCELSCEELILIGVPDFIFDDSVILQVSTSMRPELYARKCSKMFFYTLAHYYENYYHQNLKKQYTLIVYNPLLGIRYEMTININADLFRGVHSSLEKCVKILPKFTDPTMCDHYTIM
ncbi:uncharacterized protein LOC142235141 isoform X2 [Haematobia irritans]|uniref:Uncharacterized protein n=1 Tax=Haematobia irritans TaxID=7368 RepID=A0A1L8E946_HAEIR